VLFQHRFYADLSDSFLSPEESEFLEARPDEGMKIHHHRSCWCCCLWFFRFFRFFTFPLHLQRPLLVQTQRNSIPIWRQVPWRTPAHKTSKKTTRDVEIIFFLFFVNIENFMPLRRPVYLSPLRFSCRVFHHCIQHDFLYRPCCFRFRLVFGFRLLFFWKKVPYQ
jgi:hypothetical protein